MSSKNYITRGSTLAFAKLLKIIKNLQKSKMATFPNDLLKIFCLSKIVCFFQHKRTTTKSKLLNLLNKLIFSRSLIVTVLQSPFTLFCDKNSSNLQIESLCNHIQKKICAESAPRASSFYPHFFVLFFVTISDNFFLVTFLYFKLMMRQYNAKYFVTTYFRWKFVMLICY